MSILFESHPEMYHRPGHVRRQPTAYHRWNPFEPAESEIKNSKMSEEQLLARQKKMEALDVVKASVHPLSQRIEGAVEVIEEKEYLYLQDQLERCHIALDNVEADGDDQVRKMRKSIAVLVSEELNKLDVKANKVSNEVFDDSEKLETNDDLEANDPEDDNMGDNCEYLEEVPASKHERSESSHCLDEAMEERLDKNRIRMQSFDNCINLVVDVRDMLNDDLKVRFEEEELLVTGRRGDKRVRISKMVPSDCLVDKAVSHFSCDGFLIVKVLRRRYLYPPRSRRLPFWF